MGRVAVRNVYVDYVVGGRFRRDQVSRMLSSGEAGNKTLYQKCKAFVKSRQGKGLVTLSIDDSLAEKPYSEGNGVVNWHYDHTKGYRAKGINFVSALWSVQVVKQ